MSRRPTTFAIFRAWSRRLPSLAAAATLAMCTSRASAQAYLGTPMPVQSLPPAIPGTPTQVPTYLPATPYGNALQPSSLQSRQAFAPPKVAEQTQILTQPLIPSGGAPQPTMAELRKSLRDDGLKNLGINEFTRQTGARPPTAPANMAPATATSDNAWGRVWGRMTGTYTPPAQQDTPPTYAAAPVATPNPNTPPADQGPWGRVWARMGGTSATPSVPQQETPPTVQQTSATAPADQPSLWHRLTHFRSGSQTENAPQSQPTSSYGPMVLPEATPRQ